MRIALLQFNPLLSAFDSNIAKADSLLSQSGVSKNEIDILVLPELAFAGYNHTLPSIQPFLEHISSSRTREWAASTARRLNCIVSVGFAETTHRKPLSSSPVTGSSTVSTPHLIPKSRNFNSSLTVAPDGELLTVYRKTHLYFTDARWASYSDRGFQAVELPLPIPIPIPSSISSHPSSLSATQPPSTSNLPSAPPPSNPPPSPSPTTTTVKASFAICMDLNPYNFTAPFTAYELASHVVSSNSKLLVCCNAWSTLDMSPLYVSKEMASEPDVETLGYWIGRLRPLVDTACSGQGRERDGGEGEDGEGEGDGDEGEGGVLVAICNRSGIDPGPITFRYPDPDDDGTLVKTTVGEQGGGETRYTGTSTVLEFRAGKVRVRGVLGRGEEGVLVVRC